MTLTSLAPLAPGELAFCEVPAVALIQEGLAPTLADLQEWTDRFGTLDKEARRRVLALCCHARPAPGGALEALLGPGGAGLGARLRLPEGLAAEDVWRFLRILESNAFQTPVAGGRFSIELLVVCARLNHSCRPNVLHGPGVLEGTVEVRALRHVAAGEELTISYIDEATLLSPTSARRSMLRHWQFECGCPRCASGDLVRSFCCLSADCAGIHCWTAQGLGPCDCCGHCPTDEDSLRALKAEESLADAVRAAADAVDGMQLDNDALLEVIAGCETAIASCSQVSPLHHLAAGIAKAGQAARTELGDRLAREGNRAAAEPLWTQAAAQLHRAAAAEHAALPVPLDGKDVDFLRLAALYQRLGMPEERHRCLWHALDIMNTTHWASTLDFRETCEAQRREVEAALAEVH